MQYSTGALLSSTWSRRRIIYFVNSPVEKCRRTSSKLSPSPSPANFNNASGDISSHSQATDDDMDDLPLVREKVSDKTPKHIKATFVKLEQSLQTVQNRQKEMVEKVEAVEEQVLQQDKNCGGGAAITLKLSAYLSKKKRVRQRNLSKPLSCKKKTSKHRWSLIRRSGPCNRHLIAWVYFYREKELIVLLHTTVCTTSRCYLNPCFFTMFIFTQFWSPGRMDCDMISGDTSEWCHHSIVTTLDTNCKF